MSKLPYAISLASAVVIYQNKLQASPIKRNRFYIFMIATAVELFAGSVNHGLADNV
ncbi:hypothetical protein [Dendronalium sp. ChiSLP03b]|uniref:hypothetical protein n=1 Tax=Dendronalium sp. ChiSLP03b TaxID=3075381 RepID=UPI002AD52412|nr:hypothetical protein [Dendronalium sp. ChiSLP03b]MDZ8207645.1 hypothetical protein [Dendronalium sp. ChiSLP03b]